MNRSCDTGWGPPNIPNLLLLQKSSRIKKYDRIGDRPGETEADTAPVTNLKE